MDTHTPLWTENAVHRLRELIAAELSASGAAEQLSAELGREVTRDSVKTKARGLGLHLNGRAGRPTGERTAADEAWSKFANTNQVKSGEGRAWRVAVSKFDLHPIPLPIDELRTAPGVDPVEWLDAESGVCAWPLSDWLEEGSARMRICGGETEGGCPYCATHAAIAYQERAA